LDERVLGRVDIRGKKWDVESRKAERKKDLIGGGALRKGFRKKISGAVKFSGAIVKKGQVVRGDAGELRVVLRNSGLAALEMRESGVVIGGFKFAEAQEVERARGVGSEGKNFLEGGDGVAELIAIVEKRGEVPPAFGPIRAKDEGAAVERDGVGRVGGIAGGSGGLCEGIKTGGTVLPWCRAEGTGEKRRRREERGESQKTGGFRGESINRNGHAVPRKKEETSMDGNTWGFYKRQGPDRK